MRERHFLKLLRDRWSEGKMICVGLDSDYQKIPSFIKSGKSAREAIIEFNKEIINATSDLVCAYKFNSAFYESFGAEGLLALKSGIDFIFEFAPEVPVILDAKRADIQSTNEKYADFVFEWLRADAITVNPYLGGESLAPFLKHENKGVIVLCKTSNVDSGEFQNIVCAGGEPLYLAVAKATFSKWNKNGNCLLVVGATYPEEIKIVRKVVGDMPFLIPGIGRQGGDLRAVIMAGRDSKGVGMILNSSSGVIFASASTDFTNAARGKVLELSGVIANIYKI